MLISLAGTGLVPGGINLAVVAIANLSAIARALAFGALAGGPFTNLAPISIGLAAGTLIGLVVAYRRVTPVLAPLCAMLIFTGIGVLLKRSSIQRARRSSVLVSSRMCSVRF